MKGFRVIGFVIAMFAATWAIMKVIRIASFMLVSILATLAALWIYDNYKQDKPVPLVEHVVERTQPVAHVEFPARVRAIQQEQIQYGFSSISSLKVLVAEVYANNGEVFPNSNEEAGLRFPEEYSSDILSSISISTGGVITVRYAAFPEKPDAWLRVVPKVSNKMLPIVWHCESNISDMPDELPTCSIIH